MDKYPAPSLLRWVTSEASSHQSPAAHRGTSARECTLDGPPSLSILLAISSPDAFFKFSSQIKLLALKFLSQDLFRSAI